MSDLVTLVKVRLMEVPDKNGVTDVDGEARAAIKAVADWLQEDGDFYAGIVGIRVERQLKEGSE